MVDEIKEEKVEEVVQSEVVEEPINPGITREFKVTEATYKEFFSRGGLKRQLTSSAWMCVMVVAILYIFGHNQDTFTFATFLTEAAIYIGTILVVSIGFYFFSQKFLVHKQYVKSNIESIVITVNFSDSGIVQTIEGRSNSTPWEMLSNGEETEHSFFFFAQRRGILLSKDGINEEDILYIREIAQRHLNSYKVIEPKQKKIVE